MVMEQNSKTNMEMNIRLIAKHDSERVQYLVHKIIYRATNDKIGKDMIQRRSFLISLLVLSLAVYLGTKSFGLTCLVTFGVPSLIYISFAYIVCDIFYYIHDDTRKDFYKYWSDNEAGHFLWVAEHDGEVIGSAAVYNLSDKRGEVLRVVTDPKYQGQKVAERLMLTLIENCKSRGLEEVELLTSYVQVPAQKLYLKLGFKVAEKIYFGPPLFRITALKFLLNM